MDKKDIYAIAALVVLIIVGIFFVKKIFDPEDRPIPEKETITQYETKYDTVIKEYYYKPVYINKKSDTVSYTDTVKIIETHPFIAKLKDTVVAGDTIGAMYEFPKDNFYLTVLPRPDRIMEITKTNTIIKTEIENRKWWLDFLSHVGAAGIGYGIGKIK